MRMYDKTRLTVFTPTYNRKYVLPELYQSLCRQTTKNFEWIIVDDGSSDGTEEMVRQWMMEGLVPISYYFQTNKGKMAAHNFGVQICNAELFTCVDSDDYLTDDAVEKILNCFSEKKDAIGILAKRGKNRTDPWTYWNGKIEYKTMYDAEHENKLRGDTMLIFKTELLKKHLFPVYDGEKFVPEAWLYDALSLEGKVYFMDEILYISDYLQDGYTAHIRKINAENPHGYLTFIQQRLKMDSGIKDRIADTVRYIAIKGCMNNEKIFYDAVYPFIALAVYPVGRMCYWRLYKKYVFNF